MPGDFDNLFGDGPDLRFRSGILEILPGGWGFLRRVPSEPGAADIYVAQRLIQEFKLNAGDTLTGQVRPPKETERYSALSRLESINERSIRD